MKLSIILLVFAATLAGCASRIETVKINPETLQAVGPGVEGVIYYEPKLVKVTYGYTQFVDKDNKLIGSYAEGTCKRVVQKEEIMTLPDYENPLAILYKPALFAASEFGVNLNNGMLTSVTSKSTPQAPQLLEQINKAAENFRTLSATSTDSDRACNDGLGITSITPITLKEAMSF